MIIRRFKKGVIREHRERLGMTIREMAKACDGMSTDTLVRAEHSRGQAQAKTVHKIRAFIGCNVDDLVEEVKIK